MTRETLYAFLKELTQLGFKYNLWINGDNLVVEDSDLVQVAKKVEWDYEASCMFAEFDDQGSRFK